MALPAIPDELLVDIFLRLPTPEDLIRASAACVSFRRLVARRSFLRRFRKIHPPPLLGFVNYSGFHTALPPHPSAPAASAVASAADFAFTFLPDPWWDWTVREVRDGRVLLDNDRHDELGPLFKDMVVCDPLHRQYLLLPPIPDDLAASAVSQLLMKRKCFAECFLVPSCDDDEETSFRVIWLLVLETKPVAAVFSSSTGQWQAPSRSESLPGLLLSTWMVWFVSRYYAHGCFYWVSGSSEKLLVLDIHRMEFSMADHPPCARFRGDDVAIVEAGQGRTLMFVPKPDTSRLIYTVWRNNGGSSTSIQWQMENTISLDSDCIIKGAVGRHLLVYHVGSSSVKQGCYTRDVDTSQLERVCGECPQQSEAYCNFPPSLLSLPTVSSVSRSGASPLPGCRRLLRPRRLLWRPLRRRLVRHQAAGALATSAIPQGTCHADAQGAGKPELQEADPVGVPGPVIAAAAQAPNPLLVVKGARRGDIQGVGDDVMVPELREADPQGPVVTAAARALNPLLVVEGTHHPDVLGTGDAVLVPEPREAGPGGVTLCNAVTPHTDVVQGAGHDVPVSGLREAHPVGVQGPVLAAVARAPNSISSTSAMPGRCGRGGEGVPE